MAHLSRRQLATYGARALAQGENKKKLLNELAAYLVENHRQDELDLLVSDIETELLRFGIAVADVTTARPLSETMRKSLTKTLQDQLDVTQVYLRERVDPMTIGGIKITVGGTSFDTTITHALHQLRMQYV